MSNIQRRLLLFSIPVIVVVVAALLVYLREYGEYTDYEAISSYEVSGGTQTNYASFADGLLAYSVDGASFSDEKGKLRWTEIYDMESPKLCRAKDLLLIYDQLGTKLVVLGENGAKGEIKASLPISRASIANNGNVGVLMQDGDTGYIYLYESNGTTIASGQVHLANTGYPIAIALSPDGQVLCVSLVSLGEGKTKSTLLFYNFGAPGREKKDNIVASYEYQDMIIPEVSFVQSGAMVAFYDGGALLFRGGSVPKERRNTQAGKEIRSVMRGEHEFAWILENQDGSRQLEAFSYEGNRKYSKTLKFDYNVAEFISDTEVLLTNGTDVQIYNSKGTARFTGSIPDGFQKMVAAEGMQDYLIVQKGRCTHIRLKH